MIRYAILKRSAFEALIDQHNATWRTRAATRAAAIAIAGSFIEESSIWGEIKALFMTLQHNKCVFCERQLGGRLAGSAEHDVEHFRPKGKIKKWPYPRRVPRVAYDFPTGDASANGYFWLAYDPQNYAAACKPCNTARKSNYFPILGSRGARDADIVTLNASEKPLLLFPLGEHGDDPDAYLTFDGILVTPRHKSGIKYRRALVTIDFFSLNDREEILADRFRSIRTLFLALETALTSPNQDKRAAARKAVDDVTSDAAPQAACARAYLALAKSDAQKAWDVYRHAEHYLGSLNR